MGFWPFGGAKKNRTEKLAEKNHQVDSRRQSPETMVTTEKSGLPRDGAARRSSRPQNGVQSKGTTNPKAPGTRSPPPPPPPPHLVGRAQTAPLPANVVARDVRKPSENGSAKRETSNKPTKLRKSNSLYKQNMASNTSLGPDNFSAVHHPPTLRGRRSDYDPSLPRQKSSKRKAEDDAREREVRAMSQPIAVPKRQLSYTAGPLRRETKVVPGDLNRHLQRPASQVSLPLPESISEVDDAPHQNSFKIGLFAALSPRPTVRYDSNPRTAQGKQRIQPKPSLREIIPEEDPSSTKRIDDLADDLDSRGLRELLEKDRRKRERKKEADRAKLQRKLERRAERQKEEELTRGRPEEVAPATAAQEGPSEAVGLGIDSDRAPAESGHPVGPFADQLIEQTDKPVQPSPPRNPFEDAKEDESRQSFPHPTENEPLLPVRSSLRPLPPSRVQPDPAHQPRTLSPPKSPVPHPRDQPGRSEGTRSAPVNVPKAPDEASSDRRASDQSSQHLSSWTTFFRMGGRRKRDSHDRGQVTPEFSNTSRESFSRRNPPPVVPPRSFRRTGAGPPQRTTSKFREDLPEMPLSPPDSRVQSPEASAAVPSVPTSSASREARQSLPGTLDGKSLAASSSVRTLDRGRQEHRLSQQHSMDLDSAAAESSAAAVAQSLASVDSEGSWLSGKPVKRISTQSSHAPKPSQSSLQGQLVASDDPGEEDDITHDEYFERLTPAPEDRRESSGSAFRKPSSTLLEIEQMQAHPPSPGESPLPDRSGETWHGSVGRQPQVVRQASRARSKEGLLKQYRADDAASSRASSAEGENEDEEEASIHDFESPGDEYKESPILRARSVEYKGHARHISAGSARLLDIRRASTVSERSSTADQRASASRLSGLLRGEEVEKVGKDES